MLDIKNITKPYNKTDGIKDINMCVDRGQIISLIGPNGAGKSIFLKILTGIHKPSTGKVILENIDTGTFDCRKNIRYIPEILEFDKSTKFALYGI